MKKYLGLLLAAILTGCADDGGGRDNSNLDSYGNMSANYSDGITLGSGTNQQPPQKNWCKLSFTH